MSGEGGYGGYGGYGGDYGGYGGGGGYGSGGADPYSNNYGRGSVPSYAASTGTNSRRKSRHDNDDAASDVEMEPQGSIQPDDVPKYLADGHHKGLSSVKDLDSTREIYKTQAENKGKNAPNEGLTWLCIIFGLIFVLVIVVLLCISSNMMVIEGVFGDGDSGTIIYTWNYGWESGTIETGETDDNYIDLYTEHVANDAGTLVLLSCLASIVFVILGLLLLCVRYSSNLPLYTSICCDCIRIPHRTTIYTILNTIELFTRRITIVYLILGIYGLIEMTYYVSFNCNSGECYAYIYPHYGWGILLVTTLMISLCGFTETRKLDPKLDEDHLDLYWPEHGQFVGSRNCTINLEKLLRSMSNQRKIILNSIILLCLQESGLLSTGVIVKDTTSSTEVEVALLHPHGWNLHEYYGKDWETASGVSLDLDNNSLAQDWMNWGQTMSDIYIVSIIITLFNLFYLWLVLKRYRNMGALKWLYVVFESLLALSWLGVSCMFYYSYYDYYANGTGEDDIYEGGSGTLVSKFFFPDWGVLVLMLNLYYMMQSVYYATKGL